MNDGEAAWAAGLFEGEGWIGLGTTGGVVLRIQMTDEDVVRQFADICDGRVNGPHIDARPTVSGVQRKPLWTVAVTGWDRIATIFELFRPWLGVRRTEQFATALAARPVPPACSPPCGADPSIPSPLGFNRHRYRDEPPCLDCRTAANSYHRMLAAERRQGIPRISPRQSRLTEEQVRSIIEWIEMGASQDEVAQSYGISQPTVSRTLKKYREGAGEWKIHSSVA